MPSELPTIASCPHCRTILLRTPRALVHPMTGERDRIVHALGIFWFDQAHVRFDGRFHRCAGLERVVVQEKRRALAADRRALCALAALVLLHLPSSSPGQERLDLLLREGVPETASQGASANSPRFPAIAEASRDRSRMVRTARERPSASRRRAAGSLARVRRAAYEVPSATNLEDRSELSPGIKQADRAGSWLGNELAEGRYQVVDTIREATTGVVYLAHDRNLDTHVVVEVPKIPDSESASRFVRDARTLARLEHPHLVKVTAIGTHQDAPFVVTEHLSGGSLKFRRPVGPDGRPGPVSPASLREWLGEVAAALDYLHSQNRVYRGLSPASILFDAQGRAYLGGLGMSSTAGPGSKGGIEHDPHADQHALACTVYELLSGRRPDEGAGTVPAELHAIRPSLPAALSEVVDRGLSRDPGRGFSDCTSFARAAISAAREPSLTVESPAADPVAIAHAQAAAQGRFVPSFARSIVPRNYLILGVLGSMMLVMAGARVRRRRTRRSDPSAPSPHRQSATGDRHGLALLVGGGERPATPVASSPAHGRDHDPEISHPLPAWRLDQPEGHGVLGHPSLARVLSHRATLQRSSSPTRGRLAKKLMLAFPIPPLPHFLQRRSPDVRQRKAS